MAAVRLCRELGRGCLAAICAFVKTFLAILVALLMFATLGVLFAGLLGLARGGDPVRSNQLMRWRVILQGAALLLFMLLMTLLRS
jgi:Hypoxia induced protein conserved region